MEVNGWIDFSVSLRSGIVHWPDNPPVRIGRTSSIEHGDASNVSEISMGAHTGTHMDGPIHFVEEGKGLDEMPITATIGRARAIEIRDLSRSRLMTYAPTRSVVASESCLRHRTLLAAGHPKISSRISSTSRRRRRGIWLAA